MMRRLPFVQSQAPRSQSTREGHTPGLTDKAVTQIEQSWSESKETVERLMERSGVSDEAKLIAAAILQAGAWIALAVDANP
jgi:hypothetical protein